MPNLVNVAITSTHADYNTSVYVNPTSFNVLVPDTPEVVAASDITSINLHATFTLPSGYILITLPIESDDLTGTSQYSTTVNEQTHKGTGSAVALSLGVLNPKVSATNVLVGGDPFSRVSILKTVDLKHVATGF